MSPNTQSMDPPRADNFCKPPSPRVAQHIRMRVHVARVTIRSRSDENANSFESYVLSRSIPLFSPISLSFGLGLGLALKKQDSSLIHCLSEN